MPNNMNSVNGAMMRGRREVLETDGHHRYNPYNDFGRPHPFRDDSPSPCHSSGIGGSRGLPGSRNQYQYPFTPPVCPPPYPDPAPFLAERNAYDHQEKVSVRLDANQGLVVEPEEDLSSDGNVTCKNGCRKSDDVENGPNNEEYDSTLATSSAGYFGSSGVTATWSGSASRISQTGYCSDCTKMQTNNNNDIDSEQFPQRIRHVSESGSGPPGPMSSMTPLMDVKENRKVEVVITPPMKGMPSGGLHTCYGIVFGFAASLFFSLTLLLAKVLKNRDHHPISISFWRYLGILVPSVPIGLFYIIRGKGKEKVLGAVWPIHDMDKAANALALLMRGVLGSTSVILRFCSLKYLSIADSSVISYSAPVFAAIFAPFCLKDKGGFLPLLLGGVAIGGVFIICKPPFLTGSDGGFDSDTLKGVFLAALSMLCASGVLIIMRNLEHVHFSLMLFILGIWGVFEAGVLALSLDVLKVPELLPDIVMMTGVAFLTFFGQLFVLLAMKMGQTGSVSVMRSCDIFLSFLWQYLFLKTEPEAFGILSALLIILAVWLVSVRKWLTSLHAHNHIRKRWSFILL